MNTIKSSLMGCLLAAATLYGSPVLSAPQIGWYWNPAESGRGFFIESQEGYIYMGGYLYDADGRALWLVSGGPNEDPYHYKGRLSSYSGGQTLFGDYKPPAGSVDVGPVEVAFSDDQHATLTWAGGTVPLERQIFDARTPDFTPFAGWWWNEDESGRGYSIEVQGSNLFWVGFMYDEAGQPVWYFSAGPLASPTTYTGALLQFANGQTLTGVYKPPSAPVRVGTLDIQFDAMDEATFTISDDSAIATTTPKKGRPKMFDVKPEFPKDPTYVPPDRFDGTFKVTYRSDDSTMFSGGYTEITLTGTLVWEKVNDGNDPIYFGRKVAYAWYRPAKGSVTGTITAVSTSVAGTRCGGQTPKTTSAVDSSLASLRVNVYGQYLLQLFFNSSFWPSEYEVTCKIGDVTFTTALPFGQGGFTNGIDDQFRGALVYGVHGSFGPDPLPAPPKAVHSAKWDFAAVK